MKIPVVDNFFCCMELRPATLGIGWGYAIINAISFVAFLLSLLGNNTNSSGSIATSIISLLCIGFCIILILGVKRDRPTYVRMGMYFLVVQAVLLVITCLISLLSVGIVVLFVYLPLTIYCVIVVRSYYLQMTGQIQNSGGV